MELQNFFQLVGHNVPFAIFVGVMGLLILTTFIFFMNSLGARRASYMESSLEANTTFVKELRDVSEQAKEVLTQLSNTVSEKDKEIREKAEILKKLNNESQTLQKTISNLEVQARTKAPWNFTKTLFLGILLGFLLVISAVGIAYYLGLFKGLVEIV